MTFETLSGAAFMKMEPQEIAALSRDELMHLAFRVRAIMAAILTYIKAVEMEETIEIVKNYDIQSVADYVSMTPQDIAALSKDGLEQLALRGQEIMQRCPIKPGCRFCSLPDEYYLHVLLEWLTIEDQARFDMALLNHMDRRVHLHLLRDTEHGGVLSVSGNKDGYKFDSGLSAWLESRNVFMCAVKFQDNYRDIPAGFLARTGRQLLQLDLSCCTCTDTELGKLFARCPRLEEVKLAECSEITDAALEYLAQHCSRIHTLDVSYMEMSDDGLAWLGGSWRNMKKLSLNFSDISDTVLGEIAEMWPNLEYVELYGCREITDAGFSSLAGLCPRIHTLDLSYTQVTGDGLARLGGSCGNMKKFDLGGMDISDAELRKIAEMCPNLEDVSLGECSSITDVGLSSLARLCPRIHTLDLSYTKITDDGLARLSAGWRNIKKLNLGGLAISDAVLGKIAEMCQNLEEVELYGCREITDVGLSGLVGLCPRIHTLVLHGTHISGEGLARLGGRCINMRKLYLHGLDTSEAALGKFAEMCPNLEEVHLFGCKIITDVGATSLAQLCSKLRTLRLSGTQATAEGVASLREAYPALRVLIFH